MKLKIQFLRHIRHISSTQKMHVASDHHIVLIQVIYIIAESSIGQHCCPFSLLKISHKNICRITLGPSGTMKMNSLTPKLLLEPCRLLHELS